MYLIHIVYENNAATRLYSQTMTLKTCVLDSTFSRLRDMTYLNNCGRFRWTSSIVNLLVKCGSNRSVKVLTLRKQGVEPGARVMGFNVTETVTP
jgi:hypothetical protein